MLYTSSHRFEVCLFNTSTSTTTHKALYFKLFQKECCTYHLIIQSLFLIHIVLLFILLLCHYSQHFFKQPIPKMLQYRYSPSLSITVVSLSKNCFTLTKTITLLVNQMLYVPSHCFQVLHYHQYL